MRIRPMRPDDLLAVERLTARVFTITDDSGWTGRTPEHRDRWIARAAHLLDSDPGGCWVADDGEVAGAALAARRDLLWVLSSFAVHPGRQGQGVGRVLLDAAIEHGRGCLRGILCARPHPGALRRYRAAGFTLYPAMRLVGVVDRTALPVVDGVRPAGDTDLDLVESVGRRVRGATHRPDHPLLPDTLLVSDLLTGQGFAYVEPAAVGPLAATTRAVASRLLWAALAHTTPGAEVVVRYLTSDQEWAVDVGLAAGLRVEQDGFVALRHMRPPAPYVPSVPFG